MICVGSGQWSRYRLKPAVRLSPIAHQGSHSPIVAVLPSLAGGRRIDQTAEWAKPIWLRRAQLPGRIWHSSLDRPCSLEGTPRWHRVLFFRHRAVV